MLRALLEIWRMFFPSRSEWPHAARVGGRIPDPPGPEAVSQAIDEVLFEDGEDEHERLTYTSGWDHDRSTFRLDVFAVRRVTLDAALQALAEDELLGSCGLEIEVRWSDDRGGLRRSDEGPDWAHQRGSRSSTAEGRPANGVTPAVASATGTAGCFAHL